MKTIDDLNVSGRRVLVRADLNVPLDGGRITDDGKIRASLPTLDALIGRDAAVVVCSHLGRPGGVPDPAYTLAPVAARLSQLLGREVTLAGDTVGPAARGRRTRTRGSMQADLAAGAPMAAGRHPGAVVAFRTARAAVRSAVLWGYVFGLTVASAALGYSSTYRTQAQREQFAALFGSNAGLAAITGPAREIQTVTGYTVWKTSMFLTLVGAVWGLLTGTRLLRGEEEAGRYELLLAGQTTRRRAASQAVAGLGAGLAVLWAITAVIAVAVGRSSRVHVAAGPALYFALTLVAAAAIFLAAGALASQLAARRRRAAGYAGAALGVCYALRLVADSASGLAWLHWTTPLGWIEELQPLTSPRPLVLLPLIALVAALATLAVHLAGHRDLGPASWQTALPPGPARSCSPGRPAWRSGSPGPGWRAGRWPSPPCRCSWASSPGRPEKH